ncbi:unnamed protein product [Closterium sp. NIES-53]
MQAAITTPRRPTLKQPLTELLGRLGLAPTLLLLLPLATTRASTPRSCPTATSPTASTAATPTTASTAATRAPTPATSPTAATTSTASTTSTATPTTTPAATSATTAATSTTPATLALAVAVLRTSRSSPDVLSNIDVCSSSSRGVGGGKWGGGAPLKEGWARSATSSTYSNCTSLNCEEMLLEEVNSEGGGVKGEKVVPGRAKIVREASDYEVEGDEHRGLVPVKELSRDDSVVASVASAKVGNKVLYCGKS